MESVSEFLVYCLELMKQTFRTSHSAYRQKWKQDLVPEFILQNGGSEDLDIYACV